MLLRMVETNLQTDRELDNWVNILRTQKEPEWKPPLSSAEVSRKFTPNKHQQGKEHTDEEPQLRGLPI